MTLLQINSSLFSGNGASSRLADELAARLAAEQPGTRRVVRDLAREPVPHLTAERFQAFTARPETRSAAQQAVVSYSDALIAELKRADIIVLGLPMYNFGLPSTLKSYFDHVARAGETFRYTADGPVGLLTGKQAYVVAARGGHYVGSNGDTQTAYIRQILAFLGIVDVQFVYAEGLAVSEASRQAGLAEARNAIERLNAQEPAIA
jgi:FMN-dependent NADH-azoreductase